MLSPTDGTNTTPPPIIHGFLYHKEMFNLLRSIVSKSANAEFTTAPCWLVATQGAIDWKVALAGRALDRSGWLTMLQTANYLERTAKSEDIVCFPRLWLEPPPIKHQIKKSDDSSLYYLHKYSLRLGS